MRSSRRVRAGVLAAMAVASLAGVACGEGSPPEQEAATMRFDRLPPANPEVAKFARPELRGPVTAAIHRLQRAFRAGDFDRLCANVTPEAARQAGEAAHGDASTCQKDLSRLFRLIRDGGGWRHRGAPRVVAVHSDGRHATATIALDRRWQAAVPLERQAGRWKLSGLFGSQAGLAKREAAAIPGERFPAAGTPAVRVADADGSECRPLSARRYPRIGGGCRFVIRGEELPLTILTPFGDFEFDRCSLTYITRVDGAGRTWTRIEASGSGQACGDVNTCLDHALDDEVQQRGRILAASHGSFVHRIDLCLNTCVGDFTGVHEIRLWHDGRRWRAAPIDGGGASGFRYQQLLDVRGDLLIARDGG
jgi:hypothetical protein